MRRMGEIGAARRRSRRAVLGSAVALGLGVGAGMASSALVTASALPTVPSSTRRKADAGILLFTRTRGYRHDSIPDAVAAVRGLGAEHGFGVDQTEDPAVFTDAQRASYRAIVFLMTTGDVLDAGQQAAVERYIQGGGGYVGIHSASDTEYDWPWYGRLVGAYFKQHPEIQTATILVEDGSHPSTAGLPERWQRTDEWYDFQANPRAEVRVLLRLEESTYRDGSMGTDHPIAWYHEFDGGRAWYTGGGHTAESYREPLFLQHLLGGIRYAAGLMTST